MQYLVNHANITDLLRYIPIFYYLIPLNAVAIYIIYALISRHRIIIDPINNVSKYIPILYIDITAIEDTLRKIEEIDKYILDALKKNDINEVAKLHKEGWKILKDIINNDDELRKYQKYLHSKRKMKVKITRKYIIYVIPRNNISILSYYIKIPDYKLVWNCTCDASTGEECPIHSKDRAGRLASEYFQKQVVEFNVHKAKFLWIRKPEFWPPSIDTIYMLNTLNKLELYKKETTTILDVGSGTGVLGIVYAMSNVYVEEVTFAEILLTPLLFTAINALQLRNTIKKKYKMITRIDQLIRKDRVSYKPYNILISNPPYLPTNNEYTGVKYTTAVGGTELLLDIINNGTSIAENVYISYSNIAEYDVERAKKTKNVKETPLHKQSVPFRVHDALKNTTYIKWLIQHRKLREEYRDGYKYWHEIKIVKITDKNT